MVASIRGPLGRWRDQQVIGRAARVGRAWHAQRVRFCLSPGRRDLMRMRGDDPITHEHFEAAVAAAPYTRPRLLRDRGADEPRRATR